MTEVFGINPFFKEQWEAGKHPCYRTLDGLLYDISRVSSSNWKAGYRTGVWLVPLDPKPWPTKIATLVPGETGKVSYESRVEGEEPRKSQMYREVLDISELPAAKSVWAVLYSDEILTENNEPRSGARLDLITILANPETYEVPMNPETLIANHYGLDGGTSTKMSAERFEEKLGESIRYWKDKVILRLL
jgi:hypothetical protein